MRITPNQFPAATATGRGRGPTQLSSAELGGECRQVEQVKQGVAPPLPRGPVIEMPEAFVRRVQDRPQHRAVRTLRFPEAREALRVLAALQALGSGAVRRGRGAG